MQAGAVKQRALAAGLEVHQPASFHGADAQTALRALALDALIVVAYGLLLPQDVLSVPRLGCFNVHASLLPRWRGAAPIQRALLAGDTVTGVTLMRMQRQLDTGPILAVREEPIELTDTSGSLHDRLAGLGAALLIETLDTVVAGTARERQQSQEGVTYAEKIAKAEARIDWHEDAAAVLRKVRAFHPWPIAETTLGGVQFRIWEAAAYCADAATQKTDAVPGTVAAAPDGGAVVFCGRGAVRLLRVQLAGRRTMPARQFANAEPLVGARLGLA